MHRTLATGLAAALAAGAAAADDAGRPSWVGRLFAAPNAAPVKPAEKGPPVAGPLAPEAMAEALRAEQDALLRRLDVCTKLRQSAAEANDTKLIEKANVLEEEATALYLQRVARFGVKGGPSVRTARRAAPEQTLEKSLGQAPVETAEKLAPASPDRKATAQAKPFKEVQP